MLQDDSPSEKQHHSADNDANTNWGLAWPLSNHNDRQSNSWTDSLPSSAHVRLFLDRDWKSSPLGRPETWGSALRFAVNMVFADSRGACVYWGPRRVAIYNEGFAPLAAGAHPGLMGRTFEEGFPELWPHIAPVFDQVEKTGKTVDVDQYELFTERHGYLEETYFIGQFIPMRAESGNVEGFYNTCYESTGEVLFDRRRTLINKLASLPILPLQELFDSMIEVFQSSPRDIPFSLIYSVDDDDRPGEHRVKLLGQVGVPEGHACAPLEADLRKSQKGFVPLFREAKETSSVVLLQHGDGSLEKRAGRLLDGIEWKGFGERCKALSFVGLSNGPQLIGFLAIGTNPRRAFDDSARDFISDLTQYIEVKWASAISTANAVEREKALVRDLAVLDQRIRHMAQFAPVGMVQLTTDGYVVWANDQWYALTGHSREKQYSQSWVDVYTDDSQEVAKAQWEKLLTGQNTSCDLKLRRIFKPPVASAEDEEHHVWVTSLGFPMIEDGEMKFIMGTLTDVSHLKWAESLQQRSAAAASEAKRQQEEFIDITSHEMRNPLSAMYQCASMISSSIDDLGPDRTPDGFLKALQDNVDAANTILACAAHQRRIIDDVLILSRLEFMMLSITPVAAEPEAIVRQAVKMFEHELVSDRMEIEVRRHPSFQSHRVDLVCCDPSRLTQILINLISNAIKFTRTRPQRRITVTFGASLQEPDKATLSIGETLLWSPSSKDKQDPTSDADWGQGEPLFLHFSVQDTGPGLEEAEVHRLFNRFSQANSKTHIQYGGSGLGLYISRELAEKQGGRIGIASTPNVGTTFAFYIKTRRSERTPVAASPSSSSSASNRKSDTINDHTPAVYNASVKVQRPIALGTSRALSSENSSTSISISPNTSATKPTSQSHPTPQHQATPAAKTTGTDTSPSPGTGTRLLLVEDNPINQRLLVQQLRKAGCEVHVANHGVEALAFLKTTAAWAGNADDSANNDTSKADHTAKNNPSSPLQNAKPLPATTTIDLILMDWEMPIMDGLACSKQIRLLETQGELTAHIPIIATTANVRSEQIQIAIDAGVDDVITKPFLVEELMQKIQLCTDRAEKKKTEIKP